MRGKKTVLVVVAMAAMLLVTAVALANEGRLPGTKDSDELTMSDGNDRVFARGGDDSVDGGAGDDRIRGGRGDDELYGGDGDDRLKGGQDDDYLDGGEGDDYINGRGDGRDGDEVVCGDGYDVAVLGRGDVVVEQSAAAEYDGDVEPDESSRQVEPDEDTSDDGCEKVRRPKGSTTRSTASRVPQIRRGAMATNRLRSRARRVSRPAAATPRSSCPSRTSRSKSRQRTSRASTRT